MKRVAALLIALSLVFMLSACSDGEVEQLPADDNGGWGEVTSAIADVGYSDSDSDTEWSDSASKVVCSGDAVDINGSGVSAKGEIVTISSSGEYVFSGELSGSIVVDAGKDDDIQLIFDDISIASEKTAAVNVKKAGKVVLTLAEGSRNIVTDTESYNYDDAAKEEPSAAVFSKSDLTINGEGSLAVDAKFNDGITSKDVLRITGGEITVSSQDDGIIGRDAILVSGGAFNISAGGDGMKATNDEDASLGYIKLDGGSFDITSSCDGIQAETDVIISGGAFVIETGGGSANASYSEDGYNDQWGRWPMGGGFGYAEESTTEEVSGSAKALKAGVNISIIGGSLEIDSSDDSVHSNGSVVIMGGSITATSGDDGVHADNILEISGGNISVDKSYEGLEACDIRISGGDIKVTAADDGINGAGGNDSSAMGGRPGQNSFASGSATFKITDGSLYVSASGDGIDINGSASVEGGTVYVFGPTNSGNGVLDYDSAFEISGGTFIAFGSSGMLQGFSGGTQASVTCTMPVASAGEVLSLEGADGKVLFEVAVEKDCSAMVFSSAELQVGETYTLFGGEGENKTEIGTYTQSQTTMGGSGGGGGQPGGPGGSRPGGKPMR